MSNNHIPSLSTQRLQLRAITAPDTAFIFQIRTDPQVNRYLRREAPANFTAAEESVQKLIRGNGQSWYYWVIIEQDNQQPIGTICLWNLAKDLADIGYELIPDKQKKGLMVEAVQAVVKFGLETLGFSAINAWTNHNNQASSRLLIRQGFQLQRREEREALYQYKPYSREQWDLYDEAGNLTGEKLYRGQPMPEGRFHLVVHFWMRNAKGQFMIQKRSERTQNKQGFWAATGGSATSGDDSRTALQRELLEELGYELPVKAKLRLKRFQIGNSLMDVWVEEIDHADPIPFQLGPEVSEVGWFLPGEIAQLDQEGKWAWNLGAAYFKWVFEAE
ncbi:MAG: GNAT family N-acetyltransferase [Bacteroidota bacterium]